MQKPKLAKRLILARKNRIKRNSICRLWTVGEWVTHWYSLYKESKHSPTTQQVQKVYINVHIIPGIGNLFIHKIQAIDVQNFLNNLRHSGNRTKLKHNSNYGTGLSGWSVKKIRALLIAAFDLAVRDGLIKKNPARDTEPITVQKLKVACFTKQQQKIFLDGTKSHRFHVAYEMLFYTGCRRSEILGLTWDCVDFAQSQIYIRTVLVNINGIPYLKTYPKTKSSLRTIPLHPKISKLLQDHKKKQETEAKDPNWSNKYDLIFTNKDGSPHSPTYFLHNFKNAIKKLGLPRGLRVHSTRHSFATNLLQIPGVTIADVQSLGGWSDTRVLLEVYSHAVKETHRAAVEKLYDDDHELPRRKRKA